MPGGQQVALAHGHDKPGAVLRQGQDIQVLLGDLRRAVQQNDGQTGRPQGLPAALHAQLLHNVLRVPDAGGVDEPQQHAAAEDGLLHCVPGGAGNVGDDGPVIARQGVQQGGLARVGPAHDGRPHAGFQHLSPLAGGQQRCQAVIGGLKGFRDLLRPDIFDILVRIVHHSVEPGSHVQQGVLNGLQHPAQAAVQLGGGVSGGGGSLRVDEVHHGFCLGQVQAAVQKGALCELTGFGLPGPGGEQRR